MKRGAANSTSDLRNKRSCLPNNNNNSENQKRQRSNNYNNSSSCAAVSSLSETMSSMMDQNIDTLIQMGFEDRNAVTKALQRANNDISEAVTLLTGNGLFDNDTNNNNSNSQAIGHEVNPFIGPKTKEQIEDQEQNMIQSSSSNNMNTSSNVDILEDSSHFPTTTYLDLETKVFSEQWSIPYKKDEPLGKCLAFAAKLAKEGTADQDEHCKRFMEILVPDAFKKLQTTNPVNIWGPEIQTGILDMLEMFIDLVAARLSYSPVPIALLETLATCFDADTTFQRKHKNKSYERSYFDKQLGDRILASPPQSFSMNRETHGWLCSLINRFVAKDGITNLKSQFNENLTALEYNALLSPFNSCMDYILSEKYRQLFEEHIEQALAHVKNLKEEDFKVKSTSSVFDLLSTLKKISCCVWHNQIETVEELHLNLVLKMVQSSNFNAKMNSLKELSKIIENCTSSMSSISKVSMHRDNVSEWIIEHSILSKALEGNIDQNQYVEKVRILVEFISQRILKEDIEGIWKMQYGRSMVAIDHLYSLIASAASKFSLEQINYLINLIYESWQKESVLIQEKLIHLLGTIGRDCYKDSSARILEVLWSMAHEERITRVMLDQILCCHYKIFNEGRLLHENLKRSYCLKCMEDLKNKQWLVPAIRHIHELLKQNDSPTFKRNDMNLISLLVDGNDLILYLIQSLTTCQQDVWKKTGGQVKIDTLVDGRFTHEESIKAHLDLLSFLLKKGNMFLVLRRAEELWDTLIVNEKTSLFDKELGLNWFITCVDDINRESQTALFQKRVAKLNPLHLSQKGYACFKLYFEHCNLQYDRFDQSRYHGSSSSYNIEQSDLFGLDALWEIIMSVNDDRLAVDATKFLIDMYYNKPNGRSRRQSHQLLHERFLKEVYSRLAVLLNEGFVPNIPYLSNNIYTALRLCGEQLISRTSPASPQMESNNDGVIVDGEHLERMDLDLWLTKIERLLMITEEYIHTVENEQSYTSHISSFYGLEFQLKVVLGDVSLLSSTTSSKTPLLQPNIHYDLITVHMNDTLESLRSRLAQHYKVSPQDLQISVNASALPPFPSVQSSNNILGGSAIPLQCSSSSNNNINSSNNNNNNTSSSGNNNMLPSYFNSKYLYQLHIEPGMYIFIKLTGSLNQITHSSVLKESSLQPNEISRNGHLAPLMFSGLDNASSSRAYPSIMMADNSRVYDVLYKLSLINNKKIHTRIRNLLRLMPSDTRILDVFDLVSTRAAAASACERRQSSDSGISMNLQPKQAIQFPFFNKEQQTSLIQQLYNLEILAGKLKPTSTNIGIKQSAKLFRQDFIENDGLEFLLQLLNHFETDQQGDDAEYYYKLRQEMTSLILQLVKLVLCGNESGNVSDVIPEEQPTTITTTTTVATAAACPPPIAPPMPASLAVTSPASSSDDIMDFDFQPCVEHLQFEEFVSTVTQMIFLAWAAAAGNIRLHAQQCTIKEQVKLDRHIMLKQLNMTNSRNNSKSSNETSNGSEQNIVQSGMCVKKDSISPLDSEIAKKTISIIFHCFEKRPEFVASFLIQPFFADFIIEILIGTPSQDVRQCALHNLTLLCKIEPFTYDIRTMFHQILLKCRLPLWLSSSTGTRGPNQKLLSQCIEYFQLRCRLTEYLTCDVQHSLGINAKTLLTDEINWLGTYTVTNELRSIDNILFIGHLHFIRTLLTCENINKIEHGRELIRLLIDQFLFPASKSMTTSVTNNGMVIISNDDTVPEPKCSTSESRLAAYDVLVELARHCRENLNIIVDDLIMLHHRSVIEKQNEWEFMPQVNPRASCGLVGLYNGGATCYMNAVLQQMYMLPNISEYILSVHDESSESTLFYQLQQVFGHLMESKMQFYSPEPLWKVFRLWGQEINIREQQDAFDFFTACTDQIDEYLKTNKREEIFRKKFEGIFCNQMICKGGCSHRYEGEEKFMALNVAVKVESLNESLNQFVKGEVLDGTNAYYCAKCQEKRTTIKRLCIKRLPPYLCIQLKRFGYDWENNRALKFDDYFRFPWILNMEPYTVDAVNRRDSFVDNDETNTNGMPTNRHGGGETLENSAAGDANKVFQRSSSSLNPSTINYELVGIVVHSGQANAGHYYSFIKDKKTDRSSNRWYRFNDTNVEEIQLTDQLLDEECFGGTFKVNKDNNNSNNNNNWTEERTRFWNAYILLYQCIEPNKIQPQSSVPTTPRTPRTMPGSAVRIHRNSPSLTSGTSVDRSRDSLSELADLVVRTEQADIFKQDAMPSNVLRCVKDENREFLKNRDTYCDDYFQLIYKLVGVCLNGDQKYQDKYVGVNTDDIYIVHNTDVDDEDNEQTFELCTRLSTNFILNTYFHTNRRLRKDWTTCWVQLLSKLFVKSEKSCLVYLQNILERDDNGLKLYLLDCSIDDIRSSFEQIMKNLLKYSRKHISNISIQNQLRSAADDDVDDSNETIVVVNTIDTRHELAGCLSKFIEQLVSLLDKSVVEQVKHSQNYFQLLYHYSQLDTHCVQHLLKLNTFPKLMTFLLGTPPTSQTVAENGSVITAPADEQQTTSRRWNSGQAKEFGYVHELIATLALACDTSLIPIDEESIPLSDDMKFYFYGKLSYKYLKEICYAFQEVLQIHLNKTLELLKKLSTENELFSIQLIKAIINSIATSSTNDLKTLFKLLMEILLIDDSLQDKRLCLSFDGVTERGGGDNVQNMNDLYSIIRASINSDGKRAYQCVKFLINLSTRSSTCKEYLYSAAPNWETAITWLKEQMTHNWAWSPSMNQSNEDSDSRSFQRTKSAQFTLEEAQRLLKSGNENIELMDYDLNNNNSNNNNSQSSSQSTIIADELK